MIQEDSFLSLVTGVVTRVQFIDVIFYIVFQYYIEIIKQSGKYFNLECNFVSESNFLIFNIQITTLFQAPFLSSTMK